MIYFTLTVAKAEFVVCLMSAVELGLQTAHARTLESALHCNRVNKKVSDRIRSFRKLYLSMSRKLTNPE